MAHIRQSRPDSNHECGDGGGASGLVLGLDWRYSLWGIERSVLDGLGRDEDGRRGGRSGV